MTTKVVKGSIWTLIGQVAPLLLSIVATPIVIRMLGNEAYGVLILVALIPTYFGFADFGMGLASTKFGSEAFAEGDAEKEARIVRTAALVAFVVATPFALLILIFSNEITTHFNVPANLYSEAAFALKLAAVTFVVTFLNGVFNTPQLVRLRMDLNTLITFIPKALGIIATPLVIFYGSGVIGAVFVLLVVSLLTLAGHIVVSVRLLPNLKGIAISRESFSPLTRFGGPLVFSGIAAVLLVNLEKLVLVRLTSVEALAYYSLAFALAMMATMFSQAMIQSLIPAFAQLSAPDKREQLQTLFSRSMRLITIALIPTLALLFVTAKPLFNYLGGDDFGRESTWPFRILLFGLLFNVLAYTPFSLIMASGRSDIFAKLYWSELLPYICLIVILTNQYGAMGAAAAWSARVIVDALIIAWLAARSTGISFVIFKEKGLAFFFSALLFLPPVVIVGFLSEHYLLMILGLTLSSLCYSIAVWKNFLEINERGWVVQRLQAIVGKRAIGRS